MAEQVPESHVKNNNGVPPPTDETRDGSCFHFLTKKDEKITEDVVMADPNAPKETLMDELRRSHSHHESSVEKCSNAEMGEPEEKKGFLEKIKEKLPGQTKKGEDETHPPAAAAADHCPGSDTKEKKGILDKIKEKLPGHHKNSENEVKN